MEVVINTCYGGFGVSEAVYEELGLEWDGYGYLIDWKDGLTHNIDFRSDPELIEAIRKVGLDEASGRYAELKIIEIPDDAVNPRIDEYDGLEHVAEGRTW